MGTNGKLMVLGVQYSSTLGYFLSFQIEREREREKEQVLLAHFLFWVGVGIDFAIDKTR